jgi:hypothetical protein
MTILPVWGSSPKALPKVLDCDGHEISEGDFVESPARSSDPICGTVTKTWLEWPYGTPFVLIEQGPMGGACEANSCLILRKREPQ